MERTRVEFRVHGGLPPKKDGANSMWGKVSEQARLIALRQAAAGAMGSRPPFRTAIHLELEIHGPERDLRRMGDLDNFITGVCDGLMAAAGARTDPCWDGTDVAAVHPSRTIAIQDDAEVVVISARKVADGAGATWYRVALEGE